MKGYISKMEGVSAFYYFTIIVLLFATVSCSEERISFNAQIRPILNKNCVSCHGGIKQSGGFGLVFAENALRKTESGKIGIVPGKPNQSEMYQRLVHHDPEQRMPLEEAPLKASEITLIKQWIEQGAQWEDHWAYIPPLHQPPPAIQSEWISNDIDRFILEKIRQEGMNPSPAADPVALVRRLYLDIIGLPPSVDEVQEFLQDTSLLAYEKLVDNLLASPHYGEHWASMWLDLARYADSFGYSSDLNRVIWKYRDWVIQALNQDMSFDQFTVEQLAGDLLPNPTIDQLIATAFHRNSMTNGEGGAFHEEFRNAAVIDRVNTTWETWQATTMSCVQCHSHPYDPIKQDDFYQAFAFFNNTTDRNLIAEFPVLKTLESKDSIELQTIKKWIEQQSSVQAAQQIEKMILVHEPKIGPLDFDESQNTKFINRIGDDYMSVYDGSVIKLKAINLEEIDRIYLHHLQYTPKEGKVSIHLNDAEGAIIGTRTLSKTQGLDMLSIPIRTDQKEADLYFSFSSIEEGYETRIDGILFGKKLPATPVELSDSIHHRIDWLMNATPKVTTPVLVEKPDSYKRTTHLFERGSWQRKGKVVLPSIPGLFNPKAQEYANRLDLAEWLVSADNPLTARVMVNRIWAKLFGRGIVSTTEDFGTMGESPTHPALLDWLALQFANEQSWHFKPLIKSIVTSATYRQSTHTSTEALEKDPENIWLARSPRLRLSAEQIRDQALAVSGLLSKKMHGPSVMPVQPSGIWQVSFSNAKWQTSEGEDRHRRAIYTFIKRSTPYPSLITFDAAGREVCLSRRITTNTPLQALVTLNDPVFFDAARALAQSVLDTQEPPQAQLSDMYQRLAGKVPSKKKLGILRELYEETTTYYQSHLEEAFDIALSKDLELAVLTVVANSLMNLDEFVVKG